MTQEVNPETLAAKQAETLRKQLEFANKVDDSLEFLSKFNTQSITGLNNLITGRTTDLLDLLKLATEDIDKPIFKSLANDMIGVLGSFYISEDALCCLIKNLLMTSDLTDKLMNYNEWVLSLKEQSTVNGLYINADNFKYVVDESSFGVAINVIITIIDIIITFLSLELNDFIFPTLDFIREITEAAIGMLCIAMQEIIFTMRDSGIQFIIDKINETTDRENWAKCFPFMDFMNVLKKYINDYGLAKKLNDLIQSMIGALYWKFKKKEDKELAKNVKLLNMLKYIKAILLKIKEAVFSWEFCAFLNANPDTDGAVNNDPTNPYFKYLQDIINNGNGTNDLNNNDFQIADNDTILQNINDGSQDGNSKGQNSLNVPSNDEIRAFLQNYMGLTADKTDQLLGDGDKQGDGNGTGNSCGNILNPSDITSIFNLIIQQSRIG